MCGKGDVSGFFMSCMFGIYAPEIFYSGKKRGKKDLGCWMFGNWRACLIEKSLIIGTKRLSISKKHCAGWCFVPALSMLLDSTLEMR